MSRYRLTGRFPAQTLVLSLPVPVFLPAAVFRSIMGALIFTLCFGCTQLHYTSSVSAQTVPATADPRTEQSIGQAAAQTNNQPLGKLVARPAATVPLETPPEQLSVKPSTPHNQESSREGQPKNPPIDRRIMSDIQEIRALLGGGLDQEFRQIHRIIQTPLQLPSAARADPINGMAVPSDAAAKEDAAKGSVNGSGSQVGPQSRSPVQWQQGERLLEVSPQNRDAPVEELFTRALDSVVREPAFANGSPPGLHGQGETRATLRESAPQGHWTRSSEMSRLHDPPEPPVVAARVVLRKCARELELVAGELEKLEAYENADRVRQQAVDLWERARDE